MRITITSRRTGRRMRAFFEGLRSAADAGLSALDADNHAGITRALREIMRHCAQFAGHTTPEADSHANQPTIH